jgi:hypothetical protein
MNLEITLLDEQAKPLAKLLNELKELGYKHLIIATDTKIVTAVGGSVGSKAMLYSYKEACEVTRSLDISTRHAYNKRCREDPRLPPHPELHYVKEWTTWSDFRAPKYYSYEEFCVKLKELKIWTSREYRIRYREDPRFPFMPNRLYAEKWKGFSWIKWT